MAEEEKTPADELKHDEKIIATLIEEEMKQSYVDYAMSVIIGRALPDVRDGLKPVHRRILFAMNEMGVTHSKPYKKSARIVGETLGKYHPHGDSAVYDALVRMAQSFSLRYPLVDGQGNFGSVDGDNAAAMRYTEARLAKISDEILADIEKETVNFSDNFDGSLKEPDVLPSKLPNLLINGAAGIAVGMATNIPPHNVKEICSAISKIIDSPDMDPKEVMALVPGPDFPTGGIIVGTSGIRQAYATGHGKLKVRSKTEIEDMKNKQAIIITEIPYQINKSALVEEIAESIKEKQILGISDIRDESDRQGMRVVLELKKDANPEIVLNQLYKHSRMQTTFGVNLLALTDLKPKVMSLKEMITEFIRHRKEVITRRTTFDLKKAEEKAHILEGLIIALDNIDKVIALIKKSKSAEEARNNLMSNYTLTQVQSQAILDMKLQRLTSLEQGKIREERSSILELIRKLKEILGSEQMVMDIIRKETDEIAEKYGDDRKTQILEVDEEDIDIEDLIDPEDMVVTISHSGYVKRIPLETYKEQKRGGKGIIGTTTKEEDFVEHLFIANTHDYILFFTNLGRVHWLKVYKLPEAGRYTSGKAIVNVLDLPKEEHVTAYIKIKEFDDKHYLVMATRKGVVKKTNLEAFSRPRSGGIIAITLDEEDSLIKVALTDGEKHIMLATKNGLAVRFKEMDVRSIGRSGRGVRGISLRDGDEVVSMMITEENNSLLTVTENGYGKRTKVTEYRLINRGGVGVRNIICSDRNGKVVDVKEVTDEDQVLFISKNGVIIRTATKYISTIGRNTQGMRLMRLAEGDSVVAAAQVVTSDDDIPEEKPLETQPEDNGIELEEELEDMPPVDAEPEEEKPQPAKKHVSNSQKDEYI